MALDGALKRMEKILGGILIFDIVTSKIYRNGVEIEASGDKGRGG